MRHTVTKEFRFEAAHRLVKHPSKCRHLHGHSYRAVVTVSGPVNGDDMVVDFQEIKDTVGAWIADNFDHNVLLNTDDVLFRLYRIDTDVFCGKQPHWFTKCDPTAEVIARTIYLKAKELLGDPDLNVESVEVYETVSCSAVCRGE